jgi:hypothetical protein
MSTQPDVTLRNRYGDSSHDRRHQGEPPHRPSVGRGATAEPAGARGAPAADAVLYGCDPGRLYLWKGPKTEVEVLLPDFVVDSRPLFLPYLQRPQGSSLDLDRLSPSTFELVVISWLSDLIYGSQRAESLGSEQAWLTDSGFLDAAKDGSLSYGLAA